ncbi:MAG: hypothetical protein CL398_08880 [Acidiferrobacteraceae bacterium]|nr:hypothetical protein [Acidiferrobacteraceae bacterium]
MLASYNEVQLIVYKAALAAGVPQGLAELAGVSAAWLHVNDHAGICTIGRAIANLNNNIARPVKLNTRPGIFQADVENKLASVLYATPSIMDLLRDKLPISIKRLDEPLMLLGALVRYSELRRLHCTLDIRNAHGQTSVVIADGEHRIDKPALLDNSIDSGFSVSININAVAETLSIKDPKKHAIREWRSTKNISATMEKHWHELHRLAARSLVPESLKSKKDGAGAGTIDND